MDKRYESQYAVLYQADCLAWLDEQSPLSFHAVVTDPPYGLLEYTAPEIAKLRAGRGGVWRIPPRIGGSQRSPVPRFTVLSVDDRKAIRSFFVRWGTALLPVLVPGAHVVVASNPLVSHLVATAMEEIGFEKRGELVRLVRTLRGGDRPKGAEAEFRDVSAMPRSCWEPWLVFRKPLMGTLAENLRKWRTGGFRRVTDDAPFCDVIHSGRTPKQERDLAPHPTLKPQGFLRELVKAALPLGTGRVLDPFAGSGSTLAACEALKITGVGVELNEEFVRLAVTSIPKLGRLYPSNDSQAPLFAVPGAL